jgi:predicted RND superfamily exporter protein
VSTAGASVMFADVLLQIQSDGPLITGIAAVALVIMVLLVVGRTRRSYAVLAASATGSVAMIAVCALAGLKVNFLDFVALPITLGLGIDYAINVADRAAESDPIVALRSTGGTVLVCSLTTMIGYASLLVSDNLAIRGFGLASLIGEITCVVAAFVIVPAMIALRPLSVRGRVYADAASSM